MNFVDRLNRYTCQECKGEIVTIDRDEGTTPFMVGCRAKLGCRGMMQSSFYRGVTGEPTWEWRKPTVKEIRRASPAMAQHFELGGLDLHKIENPAQQRSGESNG